jgi:ParB family chromosome partitioning protein
MPAMPPPSPEPLIALQLPLDFLVPDPDQPRTAVDQAEIAPLVDSVKARGVLQPLLVSRHPDAQAREATPYMIIAGERRWRAARAAGLATVPVVVHPGSLSADDRLILQLDENDGELRRELSLYDRAAAVARALAQSKLRKDEFALRHQKSKAWVSHYLGIAHATGPTRDALVSGLLSGITVTRLFSRLSAADQRHLLNHAKRTRRPITASQIEACAQRRGGPAVPAARPEIRPPGTGPAPGAASPLDASEHSEASASPPAAALSHELSPPRRSQPVGPLDLGPPAAATLPGAGSASRARASTGSARSPRAAELVLAPADVAALLRLLGHEPRGTPREQLDQLLALVHAATRAAAAPAEESPARS